jgi:hypothetical protein
MSDNLDMLLNIDLSDTEIPPEDKIMFEMLLKIHLLEIIKFKELTDNNLDNIRRIAQKLEFKPDSYDFMLYDREKIKYFKVWVQGQQLTERYLHGKTVNGNPIPPPFFLIDKRYYLPPGSNWGDERVWNVKEDSDDDGLLTIADGRHLLPFRVIKQSVSKDSSVDWYPPVAIYNAGVAAVFSWNIPPPPLDAKVVQDYIKEEGGDGITISVNDDVVVTDRFDTVWWWGYIKGKSEDVGFFPASHVHLVEGSIAKTGSGYLKLELKLSIPPNVQRIISTQNRIHYFEKLGRENADKAGRKYIRPPVTGGGNKTKKKRYKKKRYKKKRSKKKRSRKKSKRR